MKPRIKELAEFIIKRHEIYQARADGKPKPWTDDRILQQYRFCNVYRELDTVTQWINANWRGPSAGNRDNWFAMAVARWVNWPGTLAEIGYPVPWKPKKFIGALEKRKAKGDKVWTGAYMIGTQGNAMDKAKFIAEGVLQPLWDRREMLRPRPGDSLHHFASRIVSIKNQGTFMVGQIVADIKYSDEYLTKAVDWSTWCVSGPGSRRGLARVLGVYDPTLKARFKEIDFQDSVNLIRMEVNRRIPPWMPALHAQDLQNCLCEFDKYERVRLGQGRPRSLYPGT